MTEVEKYIKYWDAWHSEWFKEIKSNNPAKIKEWKVPYEKGGGSSMALPNSTYLVKPINNKSNKDLTLKEFLKK